MWDPGMAAYNDRGSQFVVLPWQALVKQSQTYHTHHSLYRQAHEFSHTIIHGKPKPGQLVVQHAASVSPVTPITP